MMKLFPLLIVCLCFLSCDVNCHECEAKLEKCMMNEPLPVDLPQSENKTIEFLDTMLTVQVNSDNKYVYQSEEYSYEEIVSLLDFQFESMQAEQRKLKVDGDKNARYESIFSLIALCKQREWQIILGYQKAD